MYRGSAVVVYAVINTCRQVISGEKRDEPQPATLSPPTYSQMKGKKNTANKLYYYAHQYIKDKRLINICRYDGKRRGNVNEAEKFKGNAMIKKNIFSGLTHVVESVVMLSFLCQNLLIFIDNI